MPLIEYRKYLENLVKGKSPVLFSNGGKDYASILMSILLTHTTSSVCMFCEGFKPDLIMEEDYWKALNKYLECSSKTLKVLVNTSAYKDAEPLNLLFTKRQERDDKETIQVRLITDDGRDLIKKQFNGALNNFAVFDKDMYRLEYDPVGYKAFGSFNQPEDAEILLRLFNNVFEISQQINGDAA